MSQTYNVRSTGSAAHHSHFDVYSDSPPPLSPLFFVSLNANGFEATNSIVWDYIKGVCNESVTLYRHGEVPLLLAASGDHADAIGALLWLVAVQKVELLRREVAPPNLKGRSESLS